jgi:hypothetical protein
MKVRVEVVCLNADGDEQRRQVLTIERRELAMETLGMNLTEGGDFIHSGDREKPGLDWIASASVSKEGCQLHSVWGGT